MFPLIAIAAFFILGIAFFAIGKDDFGIKRIKESSNDTTTKQKDPINPGSTAKNESKEEKEALSSEESSEKASTTTNI